MDRMGRIALVMGGGIRCWLFLGFQYFSISLYVSCFFEFALFAADGSGEDGADTLFEGGAVVSAHPACKFEGGIVDVGFVTYD